MKNARFWTGLVCFTGLPMSLVMGTVGGAHTRSSTFEGRVTYHGRPVSDGVVLLESQDRRRILDLIIHTDRDGHFAGRAEWPGDGERPTRFRVHLYPDPRPEGAGVDRFPTVNLGPEPTRIDIDLRD